jgi:hypothetical protein
MLLSS